MEMLTGFINEFRSMNKRQAVTQTITLGQIVTSALMIWKILVLLTGSESPVVVVLSGSMEPGFYRGDILFLNLGTAPIRVGEVVVFNIDGRDVPIVHRVVKVHERLPGGEIDILTKVFASPVVSAVGVNACGLLTDVTEPTGLAALRCQGDNNHGDDRSLYAPGQNWLNQKHIMGRVVGFLPYLGMVTIFMNDYPWLKYALIGTLGLFVLTSKE